MNIMSPRLVLPGSTVTAVAKKLSAVNPYSLEVKLGATIRSADPRLEINIDTGKPCGVFTPMAEGPKSTGPDGLTLKTGVPCKTIVAIGLDRSLPELFTAPAVPIRIKKTLSNDRNLFTSMNASPVRSGTLFLLMKWGAGKPCGQKETAPGLLLPEMQRAHSMRKGLGLARGKIPGFTRITNRLGFNSVAWSVFLIKGIDVGHNR